jgi:hypothetical protein
MNGNIGIWRLYLNYSELWRQRVTQMLGIPPREVIDRNGYAVTPYRRMSV